MPCGNGQTVSKRKHGVCVPKSGLLCVLLLALCCRELSSGAPGDGGACSPCPGNCSCAVVGPRSSCVVNCSGRGLEWAPPAPDLPSDTNTLDLSKNRISSVDSSLFNRLTAVKELDLSNNQITTIEGRICDNLFNLTTIDMSGNPFVCDCMMIQSVSWLQKKGVTLRKANHMLCDHPPELKDQPVLNVSLQTCELYYAGCLQVDGHPGRSELVIFSSLAAGNFSRVECNSMCLLDRQLYGGLGACGECLCSTNSKPNHISEARCSAACSNPLIMRDCGLTVARDVFQVNFSVHVPAVRVSVHSEADLSIQSSVLNVSLSWDFGDMSPRMNTSGPASGGRHKYGVPGRYLARVSAVAAHREVSSHGEVRVELPPRLELRCPALLVANQSLEEAVTLVNWGGVGMAVDWKVRKDEREVGRAEPPCVSGAVRHADSTRCFQLLVGESSWLEARRLCSARGGELAVVRSRDIQDSLARHITQECGVWLGLSDVDSPGSLRWVDGAAARAGEGGPRDRPTLVDGNVCAALDQSGRTSLRPCSTKRAYVCQFTRPVRVSDAGVYRVGTAVFNTRRNLSIPEVSPNATAHTPANTVEMFLFPTLSFSTGGRLSSLELITHTLSSHTQVRFQLYRPHCQQPGLHLLLPGCGDLCTPIAVCLPLGLRPNDTSTPSSSPWGPSCPILHQWCPFTHSCLPLTHPCQSGSCPNCSGVEALLPGTLLPHYSLVGEAVFTMVPGASSHVLVQEELEDLLVAPGDFIALQHDAGPSGLLSCSPDPSSPWKQSFLLQNRSNWLDPNQTLEGSKAGDWIKESACQIRVLYVGQNQTKLRGPFLKAGLPHPGNYSLEVTLDDPDFPVIASCPIHVIPPLGLAVVYPTIQNGTVYFLPNQTSVLVKVCSENNAVVGWQGSNVTVPFQHSCPQTLVPTVADCRMADPNNDVLFAWLDLQPGSMPGPTSMVLHVRSEVAEAELEIQARVEEPLRGLQVNPHPGHRVLMASVVSYTAFVEGGTEPTFQWTVDDKPYFTYYNTVLNIIYQNAAVYKLTVTAKNHVSSLKEDFNVTVDRMNPMGEITVRSPEIVTQGLAQTLSASLEVDPSVDATFRWSFGDGGEEMHHFKPRYEDQSSEPFKKHLILQHDVKYIYSQPGKYTLEVNVSNHYENRSHKVDVYVFSILTLVEIQTDPELLQVGKAAAFEAHPLPSPYGIIYTWDFGDNSSLQQGHKGRVQHAYARRGPHTVCVNVNNTVSSLGSCKDLMVYEDIEGLDVPSSAPTELNTPTVVMATLETGNNVSWRFDMGDGTVLTGVEPRVEHVYVKDGNYTVNITAANAISSRWVTIHVQVFVLQVLWLEPVGCVQEKTDISFHAHVSGNASSHQYVWSFGDGTTNETHYGTASITHSYYSSGKYHLSLLMSSSANKANFFNWICVQPVITNVTLVSSNGHIRLGEENSFTVTALPMFDYTYLWDFGTSDSGYPIQGSDTIVFTYKSPGLYLVTVTVLNNISYSNSTVQVEVHQPVGCLLIQHNGTRGNNLAVKQNYSFLSSSDSANVVYIWDFGDGSVLPGQNVTHGYNTSGTFNIRLRGKNEVSENKSEITVTVLAPIQGLSVNASHVNVHLNDSVHFLAHLDQGDKVLYSWILCDRCTSIPGSKTMFYTFRSVGTFNVIVTAENHISVAQASIFIFVQRELEGLQIVSDELGEGCCFATSHVLHLQASVKEGTNMSFSWNLLREHENTATLNLTGKTIDLNYSTPGPCEVILKATNLLGQLTVNRTIDFLEAVGKLVLKAVPNPTPVNSSINMTVFATIGSDLQYRWRANGDLLPFSTPSISHVFDSSGLKQVVIEVSNRVNTETASVSVSVQEPVLGVTFTTTNVTEQNFVASGVNVSLRGNVQMGSNVSWIWLLPSGAISSQQYTSYIFPLPGTFAITLNASNDISSEVLSREFTVQDRIQGLEFKASTKSAAVGENVEFTISVSSGTSVTYILSISGDVTLNPNMTYVHQFNRVDSYYVNLTACNQISVERRNLHINVQERISKLTILHCCEDAIPVGVPRTFEAHIETGNPVAYLWTFDLHRGVKTTKLDVRVTYIPEEPGSLTIIVSAFNGLSVQNETKVVLVQNILRSATLEVQPQDTFINKTVTFHAGVSPHCSSLNYNWNFGDGTSSNSTPPATHVYSLPGQYVAQVNISNRVSWVMAQFKVNIRVLECDEPDVQVVQAPRMAIWRSKAALVEARVNLKGCARYGAEYLWEIFSTPHCQDVENGSPPPPKVRLPIEVDVRRLQLSLPKMSLLAKNYTLIFSLSYKGVPLRKAACLHLSVMSAKLVPIIEGGTYRVWSKTQDLQLSAEQSYDPNLDPESQTLLNYHWECVNTSKGVSHCSTLNFGLGPWGPVLGISGSELEVDVEYTFRLTVSKERMPPESTLQKVLVKSGRIPIVSLECVSCKAQSRYEISQNSYVYLTGTCSNCQGSYRGRWTAVNLRAEPLVLDLNTTTTGQDSMHLVLRRGALRDGDSYVFSLHVTDDSMEAEGVAYIELRPNLPPAGGACSLRADREGPVVRTLLERVHFNCTGYLDETDSALVYSLLVQRCSVSYCEDFCVYKGTSPEHSAFLPPGFSSTHHKVLVYVTVEDYQGASITAINSTMEVVLPHAPEGFSSLAHWLSTLTDSNLKDLLTQGDSQRVRELSLALITVLNQYEQDMVQRRDRVSRQERQYRVSVRANITRALTSLDLNTVSDIQQTSAALAQCTAVSREFVCEECQNSTLDKLESMLEILQSDSRQGTVTPTEIADNILNIMGDLIHQVSEAASSPPEQSEDQGVGPGAGPGAASEEQPHPLRVAAKAYTLSSELMQIMMHSRVLNEEPLVLKGSEIAAAGKRADPQSLLCYGATPLSHAPECRHFSIPRAFNASLGRQPGAAAGGVVQLLFQMEPNPFPFNYVPNYTVSTDVASMEFRTSNGTRIPISGLDESQAITVAVKNGTGAGPGGGGAGLPLGGAVNVTRCGSVIVRVNPRNSNRQAGVYIQLNFTSLEDSPDGHQSDPSIMAYLHTSDRPNEYNSTDRKRITLSVTRQYSPDHQAYTFFLSPLSYDTTREHFVNVSMGCARGWPLRVQLEVAVFTALCQYFSESSRLWQTDGMVPLGETSPARAVCRTRHLTAFAASLFVPPHAVSFTVPDVAAGRSLVVVLVCVMGLLCYAVSAAVFRKLDHMDLEHVSVMPLCGKDGLYKYEIQVKTGWAWGSGTTAHVGISLHGSESRSGHRHLDRAGAFTRNSLDIFRIATDTSLGSVLRVRVWHDNKGLSPAWLLQYVLVRDMQTGSTYFFLVEEWLSVDSDKTDGRVEIEVEASEEAELRHWPRLLSWELQRAVCESHVWLSLWQRPPRSPFSRLQRATCCSVLLHFILLANTVWYATVTYGNSGVPVSEQVSVSVETVGVGLVSCLLVYPLYLLIFYLFRLSRSKVSVAQLPPQVDQESLEIDDFLDSSLTGSSFLIFNGIPTETYSAETNIDLPTPSSKRWSVPDADWPDVLTDPSDEVGAGFPPRLKRGQGSRHLGVDMTFNSEEEETVGGHDHRNKYFTSSDEDLIKRILADGQLLSQTDSDVGDLSSIFGDKTEVIFLQKMSEAVPPVAVRRDRPKTAFTSRAVVTDVCKPRPLPPVCGLAALWGSWVGLILSSSISMWLGRSFSEGVALMWLLSCIISLLMSFCILEPLKVLLEGAYYGLLVGRLRAEEGDVLVECPRVERVVQKVPRVRPPQGFALAQAREEARKVHLLHSMLKGFLTYMLFLLVVLLLNYTHSAKDPHRLRLHAQLEKHLHSTHFRNISRREDVWAWLSNTLLPRLLDGPALMEGTGSVLLGKPRLRQLRSDPACPSHGHFPASFWFGCGHAGWAESSSGLALNWSRSVSHSNGAWHWGKLSVYDSSGFIQELSRKMQESKTLIKQLHTHQWLDPLTRALFVEFSLYNTNTDVLAVVSFLLEFLASERAQSSLDLKTCSLHRSMDLPLFLTILLMILIIYFSVREGVAARRQGWGYFLRAWNVAGVCTLLLAACVSALHLGRSALTSCLWASIRQQRESFGDLFPLAQQSQLLTRLSATLLFLLVLKASHQLRFLREWAVFGRALRRSVWELLSAALVLLLLLLAYAHTGHLLFHSVLEGYGSVGSACLSLLSSRGHGLLLWRPDRGFSPSSTSCFLFHISFTVLHLLLLWLVTSVLLRNYRQAKAELYRPAVDMQDYEMVELFLRRLKMWMGLSRTKEFRHKVRFEGMELPPSRSSSTSDCKSLCLPPLDTPEAPPTPDSVECGSEASWQLTSSSPCSLAEAPGLSVGPILASGVPVGGQTWRERAEMEVTLRRVLPAFDALLLQLDRVTQATEELYRAECRLEKVQRESRGWSYERRTSRSRDSAGQRKHSRGHRGSRRHSHTETSASPQKAEKGLGTEDGVYRKGHKSSHKTDEDLLEGDPSSHQTHPQQDLLMKVSSPQRIDMCSRKAQVSPDRMEAHTSKTTEKNLHKMEESALKAEASAGTGEGNSQKTPRGPYMVISKPKKVDPNILKVAETVDGTSRPTAPPTPTPSPTTSPPTTPGSTTTNPTPIPRALEWVPPSNSEDLPSSLFRHPAHTITLPTHKRKHKPPPLKNKVHPNPDRHISGHSKS